MSGINSGIKLSIVVPCYNEAKNIPLILERFAAVVKEPGIEVLLVNNGSKDESAQVFQDQLANNAYPFVKVVNVEVNQGYGFGIVSGLKAARGAVLAWTHADMQTDPGDVITAFQQFQKLSATEQVIIKGKRINRSFGQWGFTFGMSMIASVVLMKPLYDINAQPKVFPRALFAQLKSPPNDFSLDLYLLYMAKRLKYRIVTIPVRFPDRIHGESKWAFSFSSKYKTVLRTINYIFALRKSVKQ